MRDFPRFALTAIALVFVLSTLAACDEKEVLLLKRMEAHSKALKSLKADITMEKYDSRLKESDVFKGKLTYLPGRDFSKMAARIDWSVPDESLAVVNQQYVLYRPRLKQALTGKLDNPGIAGIIGDGLAFLKVSREKMKADYDIKYLGREKVGAVETFHLKFTPKVKKRYNTVELWADGDGTPIMIKANLNNNDTITISFSNIQKNTAINTDVFRIQLPKGVKITK